jgi:hypothetical protein
VPQTDALPAELLPPSAELPKFTLIPKHGKVGGGRFGAFHLGHGPPLFGAIRKRAVAILDSTRMATSTLPVKVVEDRSATRASNLFDQYFSRLASGPPARSRINSLVDLFQPLGVSNPAEDDSR